jgi:hypothetical protein
VVCWVVVEVLDANWRPGKGFEGEDTYTYKHIVPTKSSTEEASDDDDA